MIPRTSVYCVSLGCCDARCAELDMGVVMQSVDGGFGVSQRVVHMHEPIERHG